MDGRRYQIEELCELTGFTRRTIRYYVQNGLIDPPAGRGRGGYYSEDVLRRLLSIKRLQEQGLRMDAVAAILAHGASEIGTAPRRPAPPEPQPTLPPASCLPSAAGTWTRYEVAPGVEIHVSDEAGRAAGARIGEAIRAMKSILKGDA